MTLFDRIKRISKERGYSIAEVERKAGISANYMYQWKKRNPSPKALASVADVLNVSVDYLLGKTDDNSTSMKPKQVDITDDDYIMTYQGKPIPPEDMEYIKRILNGGKD
ncbi:MULTISPECIES: helix-turn-helix domain-containing protein [Lactiplantibacillus]|uniref:helix-turn-helix domain-containing protein n=1 Tax=Lactiplantibacillus TaxID=2767842 RepID=UPI00078707F7|nr:MULTISPECIES: helix-turn-helix transcriptional regulator [Lactiplantibacillus]TYA05037.1 helix-turn-helix transcriptional regulator [Lactobacillus sp. CAB1-7]ATL78487.1 XRE family transcriptional regulator [Lactiplantibacillus plantarum]ATL78531.1 XRE family transcriptional regulator [Lactiplantibacillus plantarum]KYK51758.1 XRE family transcriptional regulator [Lactiplantibacillus plantarum]KYM68956.1 XRE family transcriptional regulator [Lactiplantibacillus plantarum]